jgi:hypothetical protein
MASQSALPGDSLYPVKRAIESAHADLVVGEGSKGSTILASASDRLHEVQQLTSQDRPAGDEQVADTLATFSDQATEASDLLLADYEHTGNTDSVVRLHDFASSSLDLLASLEPLVPAAARDELIRAAGTLAAIDSEAGQRCPTCGGTPITSIPSILVALHQAAPAPAAPSHAQAAGHRHHRHHRHHPKGHPGTSETDASGPTLPQVDPGDLGPGSVLGAGSDPGTDGSGGTGGTGGGSNPLQGLADTLTGGGTSTASSSPSLPAVGDVVGGTTDALDQLIHGVVDPLTGRTTSP